MRSKHVLISCVFFVFLLGCQPDIEPANINVSTQETDESPLPSISPDEKMLQLTIADLTERLELDPQLVTVMDVESVIWSDSSLGCPQAEMEYTQVVTPGYRITLAVEDREYPYHTDEDGEITLCLRDVQIPLNPDEIKDGIPWMPVD